jgi:hypothetical protein
MHKRAEVTAWEGLSRAAIWKAKTTLGCIETLPCAPIQSINDRGSRKTRMMLWCETTSRWGVYKCYDWMALANALTSRQLCRLLNFDVNCAWRVMPLHPSSDEAGLFHYLEEYVVGSSLKSPTRCGKELTKLSKSYKVLSGKLSRMRRHQIMHLMSAKLSTRP